LEFPKTSGTAAPSPPALCRVLRPDSCGARGVYGHREALRIGCSIDVRQSGANAFAAGLGGTCGRPRAFLRRPAGGPQHVRRWKPASPCPSRSRGRSRPEGWQAGRMESSPAARAGGLAAPASGSRRRGDEPQSQPVAADSLQPRRLTPGSSTPANRALERAPGCLNQQRPYGSTCRASQTPRLP